MIEINIPSSRQRSRNDNFISKIYHLSSRSNKYLPSFFLYERKQIKFVILIATSSAYT